MIEDIINDKNVLNIYEFGSVVYGTNTEKSDKDYIVVVNEYVDYNDINIHVYTTTQFQNLIYLHEIQTLECLFLPDKNILKHTIDFKFEKKLSQLRTSISTISSNSYVKGKKKLIISGDYEPYLAIKSVFHSIRILDYGIQIAEHDKIINYKNMNWLFFDLLELYNKYQRDELWNIIDTKYRSLYNSKSHQFKILAPKDLTERENVEKLKKIFKKYNIENDDMLNDIIELKFFV